MEIISLVTQQDAMYYINKEMSIYRKKNRHNPYTYFKKTYKNPTGEGLLQQDVMYSQNPTGFQVLKKSRYVIQDSIKRCFYM